VKNKWIITASAVALIFIAAYFLFFIPTTPPPSPPPVINDVPMLSINGTDGSSVYLPDVKENSVLIFFSPDCDHCQNEAKQISDRKQIFKNYEVYFISAEPMDSISKFAIDYNLLQSNFHFAQADPLLVYKTVGDMPSIPVIHIYNNKRLVKKLEGEVRLEEIMKFL
jgi:thiol-disulfide isomerase/thioredoxin